ncbi:MAG: CTP synthase [Planctomycetes bacterium]|nr:CTP synthase [Planctomycetota bacterium]
MSRHIFVTGGVVSSLGKGLTAASIGLLLESRGLRIAMQKLDPYLNIDPGTMSPYQHGEVFVTDDGAETDLDLGHYERFTSIRASRNSNFTAGRIYASILEKERRGDYLGQTVQVIPHVTDEIKGAIRALASDDVDIVITEVGGTVGDIESLPFLEACRQFAQEVGRNSALFVHLTLVPYLRTSREIKTKPTQHSVGRLREIGILPDMLIGRTEVPLDEAVCRKLALFCNVPRECVFEERDVETSIYEVPEALARQGLDVAILKRFQREVPPLQMGAWTEMVEVVKHPERKVEIAVVGKYIDHADAYKSLDEALAHGGIAHRAKVRIRKIEARQIETHGAEACLQGVEGVLVPGGFGARGIEGKVEVVQYARERGLPFFGICLGLQVASIEFARNRCALERANSSEFDPQTPSPVIDLLPDQRGRAAKGGTMRLGGYPCRLVAGSLAHGAYRAPEVRERHRHRYEFNLRYADLFRRNGMRITGMSPDGQLVEIIELEGHPWFLAVQFHPEFRSRPVQAHPLFAAFVAAALERGERSSAKGAVALGGCP